VNDSALSTVSGRGLLPVAIFVIGVFFALMATSVVAADSAQAKYTQPNCKTQAKNVRKAKGARKRLAKSRLKACKSNLKAYKRVRNFRFTGTRSDGEPIDIVLCANGKVGDDIDSGYGQITRKGWRIDTSRFRGRYFEAGFAAKINGGERVGALKFDKQGWQVGIYSLDRLYEFGPAKRTNAKKICRTL
jgi:hypothetical protein